MAANPLKQTYKWHICQYSKSMSCLFFRDSVLVDLTEDESTWFVGITPLAMTLGVLVSIPVSEIIGRKKLFFISNILSILGYLVIFFASSFLLLMLGRSIQCLGMGLGAMTIGVFLSEISTVKMRGPLIGISQTSATTGLLISSFLCIFIPIQFLSLVLACNSLLVIVLLLFIPRSPQWLVRKGKDEEAMKSLKVLRGSKYPGVDLELMEIKTCVKDKESESKGSVTKALKKRIFTRPLLTFTVVFIVLGICGNDTFVFYGPTIFRKIDIGIPPSVLATLPWVGFSIGYAGGNTRVGI